MSSKVDYIQQVSDNLGYSLSNECLAVLKSIYSVQYIHPEFLGIHYQALLDAGMLDESWNMVSISIKGQELIEAGMNEWVKAERQDLLVVKTGALKRPITEDMEYYKDLALELIGESIEIKEIITNRSNYLIVFKERRKGLGALEIKNADELRINVRNPSPELYDSILDIGMKGKKGATQVYFDMPRNEENLKTLVNLIVTKFYN